MTRFLVFLTMSYTAGIVLGRYIPLIAAICLAGGAAAWAIWHLRSQRQGLSALIPLLLLFIAAGSLAFNLAVNKVSGNVQDYHEQQCTLVGMVANEPLWHDDRVVFPLELDRVIVRGEERAAAGTVRATLYFNDGAAPALSYGQQISVRGLLLVPRGKRNPGGFDYGAFLQTRGMAAAFYGEARSLEVYGFSADLSPFRRISLELRERMTALLRAQLPPAAGGLLVAILLGERHALEPAVEEAVRRTGVAHMLSVSGLHVALLAAMLFLLCNRLGVKGWPACLFIIFFLFAYAYITGMEPATLRSFVMIALGLFALCLGRRQDLPTAVAAAALVTLIYNPLLLFQTGLQLSYAATISLVTFAAPLQQALLKTLARLPLARFSPYLQGQVAALTAVTVAAQVGTLPIIAYTFKEISLVALPANILILPVMALLLGAGLIAAILGLVVPLFAFLPMLVAYPLLAYTLWLTETLGALSFAAMPVLPPRLLEISIYYMILILIVWRGKELPRFFLAFAHYLRLKARPFHFIAATMLLLALPAGWWGLLPAVAQRPLEVVFLDVGQGDAIFIRTPGGQNILLDGGGRPAFQEEIERVGRLVVVPYLEYRRVRELDMVIISHPHEDHYGGLLAVLDKIPARLLVTNKHEVDEASYLRLLDLVAEKEIPHLFLERGDRLSLEDHLWMEVLNPPSLLFTGTGSDENNNSLVLRLHHRAVSFLLTGDIENEAALWMLAEDLLPPSNVLKVPHHGGYMASFADLLGAVDPQVAVIPVGRNTFGHPHPHILELLEAREIEYYRSDRHGAVTIYSDGSTWETETMLIFGTQ